MTTIMVEHNSFVEGHRESVSFPREANWGFQGDNTFATLETLGAEVPTQKSNDLWVAQRASVDDELTTPELLVMQLCQQEQESSLLGQQVQSKEGGR
jgi:hypothetical protein